MSELLKTGEFGGIPEEVSGEFGGLPEDNGNFGGISAEPDLQQIQFSDQPAEPQGIIYSNPRNERASELADQRAEARQQIVDLAKARYGEEVVATWENNPIGFTELPDFIESQQVIPGGGLVQGKNALKILDISNKLEQGKEVSVAEQAQLDEYLDKLIEMEVRGMNFGGKFSYYGVQIPAFMTEFYLTGGVGKLAQTGVTKSILQATKKTTLAKASGAVARATTQTAAMLPMNVKNYGEARIGGLGITDQGQLVMSEAKEKPAISALRAFLYTGAEVASELSGIGIAKVVDRTGIKPKLKTSAVNGINKLPEKVKEGLYKAYQKIQPNAKVSKVFERAGWNGMLIELGEERIADVLRETTNLALNEGYTMDDVLDGIVPSGEQLALEAALITTIGSVRSVANIGVNLLVEKGYGQDKAIDAINSMSAKEQQEFVDQELEVDKTDVQDVDTGAEIEPTMLPDRPTIKSKLLKFYDEWQSGDFKKIEQVKEKQLAAIEKDLRKARKAKKFYQTLRESGGINAQSYMYETGADKADLLAVNKLIGGKAIFRFKENEGLQTDGIYEQLATESRLIEESGKFKADEAYDMSVAIEVMENFMQDPKNYMNNAEDQALVDELEATVEELSNTTDDAYVEYMEQIQSRELQEYAEENNIEIAEGQTAAEAIEQAGLLEEPLTEQEFERINKELNEYTSTEYEPAPTVMSGVQQAQQDAVQEEVAVAPKESIFKEWYYRWFDELGALIDLGKAASKKGYQNNLHRMVRLYAGVTGMSIQAINNNTFIMNSEGNLEVTGVGLKSILDDFDAALMGKEPDKAQRKKDLNDYLIARRYYQDLTEIEDVNVTDQQLEDSIAILDALHNKYGESLRWFDNAAQEIYQYQKRILDYLVSAGIMSQEQQDAMLDAHENYIPFQRVLDEEFGDMGGAVSGRKIFSDARLSKVIKKIYGSEKEIKDPIQSIMKNVFRVMDLAWQNKVAIEISNMAEFMPEYVQKIKTPMQKFVVDGKTEYRPSQITPKDAIVVYYKGKKEFYKVADPIIKSMERLRPEQLTGLAWLATTPATTLRTGATIVPEFWARNFLRDVHGTFIYSQAHATPIDAVRGLFARVGKTNLYNDWMKSGGTFNSYMDMSDNGIANAQKELIEGDSKILRYLKNPLKLPMDASMIFEQGVRIGVYNASKRKGMTDAESAMEARDASIDFARGGYASKYINKFVPFFNAGMQGMDKFARAMKNNPKATIAYATASITIPSVIITSYYLHFAPDEERQEFLEIPQWQKDMFWVVKVGGTWARIPKPFTIGYIFGSVPERALTWAYTEGRTDGKDLALELGKGIAGSLSPIYDPSAIIPPLAKVMIEDVTNHNFFRGHSIYPEHLDDLPPEMRETKYTSETAKLLGKKLNYSPAKIDNAIRGTFATSGQYIMDAGDMILNKVREYNGEAIPEQPTSSADIPLIRAFTLRFPTGGQAQSVQDFYELSQEAIQMERGYKKLEGAEKRQWKQDNIAMFRSKSYIKSKAKQIRNLNKRRNNIYDNLVMTGEAKEQALRRLDDQILRHARQANERFLQNLEDIK